MKPNFLIIGAARSGTTSLFKYLESHPEIYMSDVKEINFFSNKKYWKLGLDWYYRHFSNATQKFVGEASTSYTSYPHYENTAERIYKYLPNVKLIYVVRDPIDRFKSHYLHRVSRGVESREITDIIKHYPDDFLLAQGKYYLQLEQYLQYFPLNNLHCLTIDSLKEEPIKTVESIYEFLGAKTAFAATQDHTHHNVNKKITRKSRFGELVLKFYHANIEQKSFPYTFKKLFLTLAELGAIDFQPPRLDEQEIEELRKYYQDDVRQFNELVGLDINQWRSY